VSRLRLKAEPRDTFGKGAARRTRRDGRIPAVIYGHGTTPTHVSVDAKELTLALRKAGVVFEVETAGGVVMATPRDVQRDPVKRNIEHIDLVVVTESEATAHEDRAVAAAAAAIEAAEAAVEAASEAASREDYAEAEAAADTAESTDTES
jgi:large subunit ribosomal protein L25